MQKKVKTFLEHPYPKESYFGILQKFLKKRLAKGISEYTICRLYYNLYPIGEKLGDNPITDLNRKWLKEYVKLRWLTYSPDTMRTCIGDIRQFFKWCKKKGYHPKNIAKSIKPTRTRKNRKKRSKAAPEAHIHKIMSHLANKLQQNNLIYRDIFHNLQASPSGWTDKAIRDLRDLFIITFLYETGARAGEISNLGAKAMNEATKTPAAAYTITVIGKTNDRDYSFTNRTAELWKIWEQIRPAGANEYAVIGWAANHQPGQILANGISAILVRHCKNLGIPIFRAHALRHAKVKRSRRAVGLEMASLLIDHSSINTTRGYANIDEEELTEATIKTGLQLDLWEPSTTQQTHFPKR
ncbi:MAG: hypothetical protein D6711_07810 [Chloroflexi bacterium]|nr:MAG: hypothetical protein D6711_07810 [Chloroflexota bacterium]